MTPHNLLPMLKEFAPALENHLWQSTLFALAAGLLALALHGNQARVRCWLWLAASMKFLLPFSLLVSLGSYLTPPRPAPAHAGLYSAMKEVSQPFTETRMPMALPVDPTIPVRHLTDLLPLLMADIWLVGFLFVVVRLLLRWRPLREAVREAQPIRVGVVVEMLRRFERSQRMKGRVELRLCRTTFGPGIYGVARPVLLWPEGISERLDEAHLEAILAHELCHVRRRDNLSAALHMLVEAVFWFHPLVWWLGARMAAERERACDEAVLQLGGEPHVYAEGILRVCEFCMELPLACVSGVTGADLRQRVANILDGSGTRRLSLGRKLLLGSAASFAVVVPIVLGAQSSPVAAKDQGSQQIEQVAPMPKDADPAFAVATIRPSDPYDTKLGFHLRGHRIFIENVTVANMITFAYALHPRQVVDAPAWLSTAKYDVDGVADVEGQPSLQQYQRIVQKMLADRFGLKFHREKRELSIYAVTVAKGGSKLVKTSEPDSVPDQTGSGHGSQQNMRFTNTTIDNFILGTQYFLDRPVVDQTGLAGHYDFTLRWSSDDAALNDPDAAPGFFTAIQEQLGLKLEPTKGPADVFVVDQIARPSEN